MPRLPAKKSYGKDLWQLPGPGPCGITTPSGRTAAVCASQALPPVSPAQAACHGKGRLTVMDKTLKLSEAFTLLHIL